jgi:hypothetical protein
MVALGPDEDSHLKMARWTATFELLGLRKASVMSKLKYSNSNFNSEKVQANTALTNSYVMGQSI